MKGENCDSYTCVNAAKSIVECFGVLDDAFGELGIGEVTGTKSAI